MCQTYILCCAKVVWDVGVLCYYFIYSSFCWFTATAACCILNGIWKLCLYSYVCNYCCVLQNECPLNLWECREPGEVKLPVLGWLYSNKGMLLFPSQTLKRQSQLALYFFNTILAHGDLRNNRLNQLSVNLWNLAQKHGFADTKTMVREADR